MSVLKNTQRNFSVAAIVIHWLTAAAVIGLFFLGIWMVALDYYSPWYKTGPDIHRGVGVLLFLVLVVRLLLRLLSPQPGPLPGTKPWEHVSAVIVHWLLYGLMIATIVTGYLISTADGHSVEVLGLFEVPATVTSIEHQGDIAGKLHFRFAVLVLVVATLHALAALKHHFFDNRATLKRMLGIRI